MVNPKKKRKGEDKEKENLDDFIIEEDETMPEDEAEKFVKSIADKLYIQDQIIEEQKNIIEKYQKQINQLTQQQQQQSSSLKIALSQ